MKTRTFILVTLFLLISSGFLATANAQQTEHYYVVKKWPLPKGFGPGQFGRPTAIAIDPTGQYLYITDEQYDRVSKLTNEMVFQKMWGKHGSKAGEFSVPRGLTVDQAGNIYVSDVGNYRAQKFSPDQQQFLMQYGHFGTEDAVGQIFRSNNVAVTSDYVYMPGEGYQYKSNNVQVFLNANGQPVKKWGSTGSGYGQMLGDNGGIGVDGSGNVYIGDYANKRVEKFNGDGSCLAQWGKPGTGEGEFASVVSVAVDKDNNIYVSDPNGSCFQKFTSNGKFIGRFSAKEIDDKQFRPWSLAIDPNGEFIYALDLAKTRVIKLGKMQKFPAGNEEAVPPWPPKIIKPGTGPNPAEISQPKIQPQVQPAKPAVSK